MGFGKPRFRDDRVGDKLTAALKAFGWEVGPAFAERYYSDPWVFNLANAVERLTSEVERTRAQAEFVQVGTWLLPEAYGHDYDHFTETLMESVPGRCVAVFARRAVVDKEGK